MPDQPVGLRESIDLTEDDAETLRYIEGFDLAAEVSAAVEEGTLYRERAQAGELELKRFLAIAYLEGEDRESIEGGVELRLGGERLRREQ